MTQIADHLGTTPWEVRKRLDQLGVARRSNSEAHAGIKPVNCKGGTINKDGYRLVQVGKGQRLEHRVVMEQVLGRSLARSETVHHKNRNRLDNRPENLEVLDNAVHTALHAREREEQGVSLNSRISAADVIDIRKRRAQGEKLQSIASAYGVASCTISDIALGKTWKATAGPVVKRREPLYIAAARVLLDLGIERFEIKDKATVRSIFVSVNGRYRGKLDDSNLSAAIKNHFKQGGLLWSVSVNQRSNIYTLNVTEARLLAALGPEQER